MEKLEGCTYDLPWINLESIGEFRIIGEEALGLFVDQIRKSWEQGREVIVSAKQVRFRPY